MTKIKKPGEISVDALMRVLFYGQPGVGKSTLALSMPSPLMIDCDRGVHRVAPEHLSDTVQVDSWMDVEETLNEDLSDYQTVIFDTAGKLLDFMGDHIVKVNPKMSRGQGQLTLQGYGVRKAMFRGLLTKLFVMKKHVVFVAHEREDKDGEDRFIRPEIGGSSGADLIKELDLVGYLEMFGKRRVVHFQPQDKFYAKNGLRLEPTLEIPDAANGNVFMMTILDAQSRIAGERQEMLRQYHDLIELVKSNVSDCKDAESLNDVVDWAKSVNHIWDSKMQAAKRIKAKANDLGLSFDKEAGTYK